MISEPVTALTDLILALLGSWIGWRLRQSSAAAQWSRRLWAWGIVAQAMGALLGGTYHAFLPMLGEGQATMLWRFTLLFLGAATSFLVCGIMVAVLSPGIARLGAVLIGAKFGIYVVVALSWQSFLPALIDQGLALVMVSALLVYDRRRIPIPAREIAIGLAFTVIGGVIQCFHLGLHRNFNYNDIYHVFAACALWFFYRGGKALRDFSRKMN